MNELDQFCEIYGHEWIYYYSSHGMVLGPKTVNMSQICSNCIKEDIRILVPLGTDYKMHSIIWPSFFPGEY